MAVSFRTTQPGALLSALQTAIEHHEIPTWYLNTQGHLTQATTQWARLAWFHPVMDEDKLTFYLFRPDGKPIHRATFAYYQSKLIEQFTCHLYSWFDEVQATPNLLPIEQTS